MNTNANRMNESDDDNTLPPPTPCRAAAAPTRVAVKSEEPLEVKVKSQPKQPPALEVNVAPLSPHAVANEPGRLVTPSVPVQPAGRATRSSSSDVIDERAGAAAFEIYDDFLRVEREWFYQPGNLLHTYTFIPGSLKGVKNIKTKGVRGVHYAIGELELCEMIQTYGLDHAPKDLEDIPAEPENYGFIYEMKDWVKNYLKEKQDKKDASKKKLKSTNDDKPSAQATAKVPAAEEENTSGKRKGRSSSVQTAKKSKPAASSKTSKDIAEVSKVVSKFLIKREEEISALKAKLEAQKTAAASEKDNLKKKLDNQINENARLKDELAGNKDELARKDVELRVSGLRLADSHETIALLRDKLARKDGELAQARISKLEQVQSTVGSG